ncbi:hypothetical protein [Luteibacter sp. 329MFSha]|uniref:hypothetical protein n=1 Tax=Luteibacter sp. 329MFSha TaxID=1798239 RepID=UPI000B7E5AF8|nr:hypothetical protein [Luteibacter sp. 329MFSha]
MLATSVPVLLHGFAAFATIRFAAKESFVGDYSKTFEWIEFPQGRVRYAGGRRGRDEPPMETFAIELYDRVYYGEICESLLADGNRYNLMIVSFGWTKHEWRGIEPNPRDCATFTPRELEKVQALLCQAVQVWRGLDDRPPFLTEYFESRFMGEVIFQDGWALIRDESEI